MEEKEMKRIIVALATVSMVFGFVGATLAADWNFYGSARMATFWNSKSKQETGTNFSRDNLQWEQQGNSRLGANVKFNDELSGAFQLGLPGNAGGVYTRVLYGEYNFNGIKLKVGQDYTPVNIFYSNQVWGGDTDLLDTGMPYNGRRPEIQLSFQGFELAFIQPVTSDVSGLTKTAVAAAGAYYTAAPPLVGGAPTLTLVPAVSAVAATTNKTEFPKVEAKYTFTMDNVTVQPYAGYNTFKVVDDSGANKVEQSVDSWIAGLGVQGAFGPVSASATAWLAQNPTSYGLWNSNKVGSAVYDGKSVINTNAWGGGVVLGYTINDMISVEAGYGYNYADNKVSGVKTKGEVQEYYLQAPITLAKNVVFTPEIGKIDLMSTKVGGVSTKNGDEGYVGGKWQINF
jgi:hypothetical protein